MKDWMKGPFLNIGRYKDTLSTTITEHKDLFDSIFNDEDRGSAFVDYMNMYHSEALSVSDVEDLLHNFQQCSSCETWYDADDLLDTEEQVNGGVGMVCGSCLDTLE